ncbi:MAG: hypothetical protein V1865_03050, partial [bacterium]
MVSLKIWLQSFKAEFSLKILLIVLPIILLISTSIGICIYLIQSNNHLKLSKTLAEKQSLSIKKELDILKNQDQLKRNLELQEEIKNINQTYQGVVTTYEEILKLQDEKVDTTLLSQDYAQILVYLSNKNYSSGSALLVSLNKKIAEEKQKLAIPEPAAIVTATVSNQPPGTGYQRQQVKTDSGTFLVSIVAADLNTARVIVDTASESDCTNDCPVLPLADYVSRSGAFAGVNGSYFCPATYPSCADKKNSFDTLLMNKNKKYINSDNNVYSTVPLAAFNGTQAIFKGQSL